MTNESLQALKRMIKECTNPEESRNALLQLLKRDAIEPDEVMQFIDLYKSQTKLKPDVELPKSIKVYVSVSYEDVIRALRDGENPYVYATTYLYKGSNVDEIFEVELPLSGYKKLEATKLVNEIGRDKK